MLSTQNGQGDFFICENCNFNSSDQVEWNSTRTNFMVSLAANLDYTDPSKQCLYKI